MLDGKMKEYASVDSNQDVGVRVQDSKVTRAGIMAEQDAQRGGSQAEIKAAQQDRIDERVLDTAVRRSGGSEAHRDYALENLQSDAPPMEIRRQEQPDMMSAPQAVQAPEAPSRPDHSGTKEGFDLGDLWGSNSRFSRWRDDRKAAKEQAFAERPADPDLFKTTTDKPNPWSEQGDADTYYSPEQRSGVRIDQLQKYIGNHGGFGSENSEQIMQLQEQMQGLGLYKGKIDGKFGAKSLKALRDYQSGRGQTSDPYDSRMGQYTSGSDEDSTSGRRMINA